MDDNDELMARVDAERQRLATRSRGLSLARAVVFLAAAALLAVALASPSTWAILAVFILGAGFLFLAARHAALDDALAAAERRLAYHRGVQERRADRWARTGPDGRQHLDGWHPYATDLDLVGPGGLYQRLDIGLTHRGGARLAAWMLGESTPADQQEAVRALVDARSWRADLHASFDADAAAAEADRRGDPAEAALLQWIEDPGPMPAWVGWGQWPLRLIGVGVPVAFGFQVGIGVGLVSGLFLAVLFTPLQHLALRWTPQLDGQILRRWCLARRDALSVLARAQGDQQRIAAWRTSATTGDQALAELASAADALAARHNPLWFYGVGALIVSQWRASLRLRRWAREHGADMPAWLSAIADAESCAALAGWADEQGGAWASEAEGDELLAATDLRHPLLPRDQRVGNDAQLVRGEVLLLTGANASGKSTWLRTCCLTWILARLGTTIPAGSVAVRDVELATVMRVHDDLLAGRSRFQAEVWQLKQALGRVGSSERPVVLVFDEILSGTNSRERFLGTRALLDHLRGLDGCVLVTTHDLELAKIADDDPQRVHLAHFADRAALEERADAADVAFDYRLRPGVVQSTNALRVMRAAGLPVAESQSAT